MREIKFRAWDKKEKKWLLGYEMPNLGGFSLFGEIVMLGEWSQILDQYIFERNGHKQEDLVVMQFTGLKDKNGKEIYEGDILKCGNGHIGEVEWEKHDACFNVTDYYKSSADYPSMAFTEGEPFEVLGNIYENPELLK